VATFPTKSGALARVDVLSTTSPGFATPVTAPATSGGRDVRAVVTVLSAAVNIAFVALQVETGVATGVYTEVGRVSAIAMVGVTGTLFSRVPSGRRYQFVKGGLAGTTETIDLYGYTDT